MSGQLNITELFRSIQGESTFAGCPTAFIRLAACNLRCTWCDTPYSFGRGTPHTLEQIYTFVEESGCPYVCITGGEPLLQENVHPLMQELCDRNYRVSIETGGSLPTESIDPRVFIVLDVKCPGSGMSQKNLWKNLDHLRPHDQVKFVLDGIGDYNYAKRVCIDHQLFERDIAVLFSPVHGTLDAEELAGWILEDKLPVRLNLQIHKFIWPEKMMGV